MCAHNALYQLEITLGSATFLPSSKRLVSCFEELNIMMNLAKSNAEKSPQEQRPIPQADCDVKPGQTQTVEHVWTPDLTDDRYDNVPCTD
jgi:hypothetical protein